MYGVCQTIPNATAVASSASADAADGACLNDADHTIWEAKGKAAFTDDMTSCGTKVDESHSSHSLKSEHTLTTHIDRRDPADRKVLRRRHVCHEVPGGQGGLLRHLRRLLRRPRRLHGEALPRAGE